MSLLMEALKRAEENKQGAASRPGEPAPPPADSGISLEPLNADTPAASAPRSLPDLASHLDAVDADLAAAATPEPLRPTSEPAPTPPRPDPREAAHAMFAAKSPPEASRAPLYLTLGLLGLVAVGIGVYFWLQLQGLAAPPPPTHSAPTAAPAPMRAAELPRAPKPISPAADVPPLRTSAPPALPATRTAAPAPSPAARPEGATQPAASPIRLTRNRLDSDPALTEGWRHLQAGRLDSARQFYEQALKSDAHNADALAALSAIAEREGRAADADALRQQAAAADPRNATVLAALIAQTASSNPLGAESRLKSLIAEQPQAAPLHFALGNLHARQGLWHDAQQDYFNAVAIDGDNPDYLFNLAVSLDRLRQTKIAAQYYRQALDAAEHRLPAFDRKLARQRLDSLSSP